jgi:hypothetical protein
MTPLSMLLSKAYLKLLRVSQRLHANGILGRSKLLDLWMAVGYCLHENNVSNDR